jgi:UDP-N-acetylmuramate dehydrogenase
VLLESFTTFRIGGPALYFIPATSETVVQDAVEFTKSKNLPLLVLGGGSNLLIADEGFRGVVLHVEVGGLEWLDRGSYVQLVAGAGENWDPVVAQAVERRLYGFECLSGIPGSVGGTPVQNVGAYGQEISETLESVRVYDRQTDRWVRLDRQACHFSYRSSILNTTARGRYIVVSVTFRLNTAGKPFIQYPDLKREFDGVSQPTLGRVRDAVLRIRARKAMLIEPGDPDCRSAGSFFKNPIVTEEVLTRIEAKAGEKPPRYPAADGKVKTAAAWLIERAGISKGYSIGPAAVSTKHTLALVNKAGATAADVIKLAREIRTRVEDRFGIRLTVEPVFVGFDDAITTEFQG